MSEATLLLIASPADKQDDNDTDARALLDQLPTDIEASAPHITPDGVCMSISLRGAAPFDTLRRTVLEALAPQASRSRQDVAVLSEPPMPKRLLIADMESTIIKQEMLDELADFVGKRDEVEAITAAAMRGELNFEAAINARVELLEGLSANVLDTLIADRLTYMPGARALLSGMKRANAYCALVSGGFTHFTAHVAHELGFDTHRANTLGIKAGKLTGAVVPPILGQAAKREALDTLCSEFALSKGGAIAVGDGSNDLAMLHDAGLGVAFRAKPTVRNAMAAHPRGVIIDHCDLTALLYLQGLTPD